MRSASTGTLRVYKGCNPGCTLVGTSTLHGESLFGNLDTKGTTLAVGPFLNGAVDVYKYNSGAVRQRIRTASPTV